MSVTRGNFTPSLGAALERDRLERRVRRATVAVAALRATTSMGRHREGAAAPPRQLRYAIADFEAQIDTMNARLSDLAHNSGAGTRISRSSDADENNR
jgi:hypothetical protein